MNEDFGSGSLEADGGETGDKYSHGTDRLEEPEDYWEVLQAAVKTFEDWEHFNKLTQEPAELIVAATDWDSRRADEAELIDELVDVRQVVDGFVLLLEAEDEFEERLAFKSSRLADRVEDRELMPEEDGPSSTDTDRSGGGDRV